MKVQRVRRPDHLNRCFGSRRTLEKSHFGHNNILKHSMRLEFCDPEERAIIEAAKRWDDLVALKPGGADRLRDNYRAEYDAAQIALRNLRPSDESTNRMDEALIANWNRVVAPRDIVYHLGDIFLYRDVKTARLIKERLNGAIRLINGNHDKAANQMRDAFDWVKDYYEAKIPDEDANGGYQRIVMMHYAMRTWNGSHRCSWHLYGHSHHTLPDLSDSKSFDVGVDGWGFTPLSYSQVKEIMAKKTCVYLNHNEAGD